MVEKPIRLLESKNQMSFFRFLKGVCTISMECEIRKSHTSVRLNKNDSTSFYNWALGPDPASFFSVKLSTTIFNHQNVLDLLYENNRLINGIIHIIHDPRMDDHVATIACTMGRIDRIPRHPNNSFKKIKLRLRIKNYFLVLCP